MNVIEHLILGGGGLKGIYMLGILDYLEENKLLSIKSYTCTSVGTIIGFLHLIGYKPKFLLDYITKINYKKILNDVNIFNLFNEGYGLSNNSKLIKIIELFMTNKKINLNITFKELYDLFNVQINIIGTSICPIQTHIFNHINCPSMNVLGALKISINIPFIFPCIKYNNLCFVDGSLSNNYGLDLVDKENYKTTLGILIVNETNTQINNLYDYASYICDYYITENSIKKSIEYKNIKQIIIYDKLINNNLIYLLYTNIDFEKIYKLGYTTTQETFKT